MGMHPSASQKLLNTNLLADSTERYTVRFFVASWFFPPSTSSEGIVTYKLFRNSEHEYDVCSSQSTLWSYQHELKVNADNIHVLPVDTDDFDVWIERAVELFEKNHATQPYDAIMTRSMPPESVEIARRIKETHPNIPWVASLADPIAKSPYDYKGLILEDPDISDSEKHWFRYALRDGCSAWETNQHENIRTMCAQKTLEDYVINTADALIFPCDTLKNYVLASRRRKNALVVPHSYDLSLYPEVSNASKNDDRIEFCFIGHSDVVRSLKPFVLALNEIRKASPHTLDKIHLRFIGNTPEEVRTLINNYYLYDTISVESSVDYLTSLKIMKETDWLLHVDALFDFLDEPGGSIFFAGKLADYMGTDKPILSLTGKGTPADIITRRAGGISIRQDDIAGIAEVFESIADGTLSTTINREYRDSYSAPEVAKRYDQQISEALDRNRPFVRRFWPVAPEVKHLEQKMLSICVPAYNVECYLDRCLHSLVTCEVADWLEVLVVNDGSPDSSREIALAYQEHYPNIVTLIDKENGGHGSTINAALAKATGLYFRVIDGDDWVDSANLAKMLKKIESEKLHADLVSSNYHQVYIEDGHTVPWMKVSGRDNYVLFDLATEDMTMEYFTMASTMVKTDILRSANFKIQENTFYVDVEYILFPIPYVNTVMFTPEFIYRYAVGNADQSINPDIFTRRYDHHDRVIRRMLTYYANHKPDMSKGQKEYMSSLFVRHLLKSHYTLSLMWDTDKERGFARAKDFDEFFKSSDSELYEACRKRYPQLKKVQDADFDPDRITEPIDLDNPDSFMKSSLKKIARTKAGSKLAHNRYARAIARRVVRH